MDKSLQCMIGFISSILLISLLLSVSYINQISTDNHSQPQQTIENRLISISQTNDTNQSSIRAISQLLPNLQSKMSKIINSTNKIEIIYNNKQSISHDIIKISPLLSLELHQISPLYMNITKDYSKAWQTYPEWYQNDSIVIPIHKNLHTNTKISNIFNHCWLSMDKTNIFDISTAVLMGTIITNTKRSPLQDSKTYFCKFSDNDDELKLKHDQYLYFGIYSNIHDKIIYFDVPKKSIPIVKKHYLSVVVHGGIFGYPPHNFMQSFFEYYIFHGVTQFYLYHMQCDYYHNKTKLIQLFESITIYNQQTIAKLTKNLLIEIWFFDASLPFVTNKRHNSYQQQFWVINHALHHSKFRSSWNICIDLDETVVPVLDDTIYSVCKYLDSKNSFEAFNLYRFGFKINTCLMVNNSNKRNVFRNRKHVQAGKVIYKTSTDVIRLEIHSIRIKNSKLLAKKAMKYFYVANTRLLGWEARNILCKVLVFPDNLTAPIIYDHDVNNKTTIVNSRELCIDQQIFKYKYSVTDVGKLWQC